jgi:5,10-methylenetetrahydromethanopterin reductase
MEMQFAVGTGRNEGIHEIGDISQTAERAGFDYITFLDSQNVSRDVYSMMTVAALNTKTIKIGHGVTVTATRHPSVTANATATIDEISGGRAFVGLGAGWSAVWTMGQKPARLKDVRDTVQFIQGYTAGKIVEYKGANMQSEWIKNPLKVYIGGGGPKMLRLAGEVADGVILSSSFGINPIALKWKLENIYFGAESIGRDPSTIDIWARAMMYVSDTADNATKEVSGYAVNSALSTIMQFKKTTPEIADLKERMIKAYPWLMDDCQKVYDLYEPYMHERFDTPAAHAVTKRLLDIFHMAGTQDQIAEKIEKIGEIGIKTVATTLYTIVDKKGMIQEIGNKIIPKFHK